MEHIQEWMKHRCAEDSTKTISVALERLFETRANHAFDGLDPPESFMRQFAPFQDDPALQRALASAAFFLAGAKIGMNGADGKHRDSKRRSTLTDVHSETTGASASDPLALFPALARFRRHLEEATCDVLSHDATCSCETLRKLYGPRHYHCTRLFCSAHVGGFPTKEARDQHLESHTRNFKCPESDCVFASTGFRSRSELSRHTASAHRGFDAPVVGVSSSDTSGLSALPQQHRRLILEDAVINSRLDVVQRLLSTADDRSTILSYAAKHSTVELLEWLLDFYVILPAVIDTANEPGLDSPLRGAIESENLPNIKLLLSRGANIMKGSFWGTPLVGALQHWNADLMRFLVQDCGVIIPANWPDNQNSPADIFRARHVSGMSLDDVRRRFAAIKPYVLWPEAYPLGPCYAAQSGSPSVVRVSLENGGDPNAKSGNWTPLCIAARMQGSNRDALEIIRILLEYRADPNIICGPRSSDSALFWCASGNRDDDSLERARLLLQHGADPNPRKSSLYPAIKYGKPKLVKLLLQHGANPYPKGAKRVDQLAGMRKIERYFGAPWNDIVRRVQEGEDLKKDETRRKA